MNDTESSYIFAGINTHELVIPVYGYRLQSDTLYNFKCKVVTSNGDTGTIMYLNSTSSEQGMGFWSDTTHAHMGSSVYLYTTGWGESEY